MDINPKELQRFYDAWGPVITALPAIINSVEQRAELQTHVDRLKAQVKEAQDAVQQAVADRAKGLADVETQLQALTVKKRERTQELKEHERACADKIALAAAKADTEVASHATRAADARKDADAATANLQALLADADAQVAARLDSAKEELAAIEQRKAAAESAFDALRAKLG